MQASGRTYLQYEEPEDVTEQDAIVERDLANLSEKIRLLFVAPNPSKGGGQIHAAHCVSQSHFGVDMFVRGEVSKMPDVDTGAIHYLAVNQAYSDWLTNFGKKRRERQKTSPSDFVRATFSLAGSLVHEVGHAFYARDRVDRYEDYTEPYFDLAQHGKVELGFALEHKIFNVSITTVVHPERGIALEWSPIVKEQVGDRVAAVQLSHLTFPLCPKWMHKLMTEKFWIGVEGLRKKQKQLEALFVPTAVNHGATLTPGEGSWAWNKTRKQLVEFGYKLDCEALVKEVSRMKEQDESEKVVRILRIAAEKVIRKAKKKRVRKIAVCLSVAAGPIIT